MCFRWPKNVVYRFTIECMTSKVIESKDDNLRSNFRKVSDSADSAQKGDVILFHSLSGEYLNNLYLRNYKSESSGALHIDGAKENKVGKVKNFVTRAT